MSTKELAALIGKTITLDDQRTDCQYDAKIVDAKTVFGNLRLTAWTNGGSIDGGCWFEPTKRELDSVR